MGATGAQVTNNPAFREGGVSRHLTKQLGCKHESNGFFKSDPETGGEVLRDIEVPKPAPTGRDLLVKIAAVSVNPVDVKTRSRVPADKKEATILGYDAAGVVESVGDQVKFFKPGDEVFYAGTLVRPGTYAEFHLVDERIVGRNRKAWASQRRQPSR